MKNVILTLGVCVSLYGCAHSPVFTGVDAETEQKDELARLALEKQEPVLPVSPVRTPKNVSNLGSEPTISQDKARKLWQQDRNNLRACVATHDAIIGELTVKELL